MLKILTVGDGDLTLSLAVARAYGDQIQLTASVLENKKYVLEAFPDAPLVELEERMVPVRFETDATQLFRSYPENHWDLIIFHHPHLGLASLGQDEGEHATRHFALLCHYFFAAKRVAEYVHVCLCGTQPDTWKLLDAAQSQGLQLLRKIPTSTPFSKIWTEDRVEPSPPLPGFAAPRRYRNGKLGSRHVLGKYGYRHRRTAGELYNGVSGDMNVAGSMHFVFQKIEATTTDVAAITNTTILSCPVCGLHFASQKGLDNHHVAPAKPQAAEESNVSTSQAGSLVTRTAYTTVTPLQKNSRVENACSPDSAEKEHELVVAHEHDGKRLRWFLQHTIQISKRQAEVAIQRGTVLVDGKKALDSSRILQTRTNVTVLKTTFSSTVSGKYIEVLHREGALLVVKKPSGMRTKGAFEGTLENGLSQQEGGKSYESLSKLDTSCPGLCVLMEQKALTECQSPHFVQHRLIALIHGRVPDDWLPKHQMSVTIKRKWNKRKHNQEEGAGDERPERATVVIVPLQRTATDSSMSLSTVCIQTEHPSTASICQWMRHVGFPVVGDTNCRQEYLQLQRSIRNRIKNKLCIGCYQVEWQRPSRVTKVPEELPAIPEKLSAAFWESNFGEAKSAPNNA